MRENNEYVSSETVYSPLKQLVNGDLQHNAVISIIGAIFFDIVFILIHSYFSDILAIVTVVGDLEIKDIQNLDKTSRNTKFLKVQLLDDSMTPEDDDVSGFFVD